ncbi:hypothetical protein VM77_06145 [Citromicrobium sp. JL31]|nr:hypothetical protein VO58_08355 [Citromicrobium sp. JL1351]KPM19502.1 hypothetical protein VM77_06145 [Citromicrobium sp. JL31]KPM26437.1 hypothetical protein VO57_09100 [Citromicrobium sp. JL2201]
MAIDRSSIDTDVALLGDFSFLEIDDANQLAKKLTNALKLDVAGPENIQEIGANNFSYTAEIEGMSRALCDSAELETDSGGDFPGVKASYIRPKQDAGGGETDACIVRWDFQGPSQIREKHRLQLIVRSRLSNEGGGASFEIKTNDELALADVRNKIGLGGSRFPTLTLRPEDATMDKEYSLNYLIKEEDGVRLERILVNPSNVSVECEGRDASLNGFAELWDANITQPDTRRLVGLTLRFSADYFRFLGKGDTTTCSLSGTLRSDRSGISPARFDLPLPTKEFSVVRPE